MIFLIVVVCIPVLVAKGPIIPTYHKVGSHMVISGLQRKSQAKERIQLCVEESYLTQEEEF